MDQYYRYVFNNADQKKISDLEAVIADLASPPIENISWFFSAGTKVLEVVISGKDVSVAIASTETELEKIFGVVAESGSIAKGAKCTTGDDVKAQK